MQKVFGKSICLMCHICFGSIAGIFIPVEHRSTAILLTIASLFLLEKIWNIGYLFIRHNLAPLSIAVFPLFRKKQCLCFSGMV